MTAAEERLTRLEAWREQFARDQERRNEDVESRLRRVERSIYIATGIGIAANFVLALGLKLFLH